MPDSIRRILTALIAAPVVIGIAYVGGWAFAALVAAIGLLAQSEVYAIARSTGLTPSRSVGFLLGAAVVAGVLVPSIWAAAVGGIAVLIALAPVLIERESFLANLSVTIAAAVYPTGLLAGLVAIRAGRGTETTDLDAFFLVMMTFFLVWATDVFAYYVGKTVGSTPLAPSISPNKTWEGSVGGAVAAALVACGFKLLGVVDLAWMHLAAVAVICGVLSQAGDLAESQIKRSAGVKDASSVLPGHGGLLDRFDAMAVAAPLVFLYLYYVAGVFT